MRNGVTSPLAMLGAVAACSAHSTPTKVSNPAAVPTVTFRPDLRQGTALTYHFEARIDAATTAGSTTTHDSALLQLDDRVVVTGPSEIREQFSNAHADGTGVLGSALRRIASALPRATVTTRFDAQWRVTGRSIEGTEDDDVRTMIMNLTPVVSFRQLPAHPVAPGASWESEWGEAMASEHGSDTGNVATKVRYTLRSLEPCKHGTCATIVGHGEDTLLSAGNVSSFRGEQRVEVPSLIPISKRIESRTRVSGEASGDEYVYENMISVDIDRRDP